MIRFQLLPAVLLAVASLGTFASADTVINVNLRQAAAGGPAGDVQQADVVWSSGIAPAEYTGTTWNNLGFTGGTFGAFDSDGNAGAAVLTANGSANAWSNNSPIDSLATYWFAVTDIDINGLAANSEWDVYVFSQDLNQTTSTFTVGGTTQSVTDADDESTQATWVEGLNYSKFSSVFADATGNINITRDAGAINGFQLVSVEAIPEPSSLGLVGLASALCFLRRRRS